MKDIVKLRLKEDLSPEFIDKWESQIKPFMVKGWETWIDINSFEAVKRLLDKGEDFHLHPENALYWINFSINQFEVIE